MIRVTVEVVPHGNNEAKYQIHQLEISNVRTAGNIADYEYELATNAHDLYTLSEGRIFGFNRDDGALELVRRVLTQFAQPAAIDGAEIDSPSYTESAVEELRARGWVRINDPRQMKVGEDGDGQHD